MRYTRTSYIGAQVMRAAGIALLMGFAVPAASGADLGGAPTGGWRDDTAYAPAFSWTGFYVGAHVGYAWSQTDWQDTVTGMGANQSGSGGLAGMQLGYNWQVRRFVLGLEADASGTWIDGSTACLGGGFTCAHSYNWLASARGRLGYAFNGNRTLLYGTAGLAWADSDYTTKDATGTPVGAGFSERNLGWVAGAGIEHKLSQNLSARVEYLYYGFDGATAPAGALGPGPTTLNPSTQTLRFGLNLKF
jgi:outer membrane immunogenic protein